MAVIAGLVMSAVLIPLFSENGDQLNAKMVLMKTPFKWAVLGWGVILICDLLVSWGVTRIYGSENRSLSILTAGLRYVYSAVLAAAIIFLVLAIPASSESTSEANDSLAFYLNGFQTIWSFGLIIFGFHLMSLSRLVCQKQWLQRTLAILLFLAGIGYLLTNIGNLLVPSYPEYKPTLEAIFMLPMVLGEVGWGIWLIVKGGKNKASTH